MNVKLYTRGVNSVLSGGVCIPTMTCHISCDTCSGSLNTQCLTCLSGTYLNPTFECLSTCPNGTYKDNTALKC